MTTILLMLSAALALVALAWFGSFAWRYLKWRGPRVVTCPEAEAPAGVALDMGPLARAGFLAPRLRLKECSRWPEREGCDQACLAQIEAAPEDCLVRTILTRWYSSRPCALCGRVFLSIHWHDHKPALLAPDGRTIEWREIRAEEIPAALATCRPVCWNCHIAESFLRRYPDRAVERPWRWSHAAPHTAGTASTPADPPARSPVSDKVEPHS